MVQFENYPSPWAVYSAISTDSLFVCPARRTARWATASGMKAFVYVAVTPPLFRVVGLCLMDLYPAVATYW